MQNKFPSLNGVKSTVSTGLSIVPPKKEQKTVETERKPEPVPSPRGHA